MHATRRESLCLSDAHLLLINISHVIKHDNNTSLSGNNSVVISSFAVRFSMTIVVVTASVLSTARTIIIVTSASPAATLVLFRIWTRHDCLVRF